jgi:hypothetical protein
MMTKVNAVYKRQTSQLTVECSAIYMVCILHSLQLSERTNIELTATDHTPDQSSYTLIQPLSAA